MIGERNLANFLANDFDLNSKMHIYISAFSCMKAHLQLLEHFKTFAKKNHPNLYK